ncbi:MAG: class I SAM-dependent methyltransferase [Pyrinomonadaceae bacterium]
MPTQSNYDAVPYPSMTFPQTHPDVLATAAAFFGMETADPESCSVLELGCGDGMNLISFASILKGSRFVGIDLSSVHIDHANRSASELKLENTKFIHGDVTDINRGEFGTFDFVIAHGLYSWVPEAVRTKILEIYAECLAPRGVGYISYNAYPGYRIWEMFREMMRYHVAHVSDAMAKVQKGRAFLKSLGGQGEPNGLYQALIRAGHNAISAAEPASVFHDELSDVNQPFYFHEFVAQLREHGLQFLCEVDPAISSKKSSFDDLRLEVDTVDDIVKREQYVDFIEGRRFRSSLFCRNDIELDRRPGPDIVRNFCISSRLRPKQEHFDILDESEVCFVAPNGGEVSTALPLTKSVLVHLQNKGCPGGRLDELLAEAQHTPGASPTFSIEDIETTAAFILQAYEDGLIEFHKFRPNLVALPGKFPVAHFLARWQIAHGFKVVSTGAGTSYDTENDMTKLLILLLDGSRDRESLLTEMRRRIEVDENRKETFEQNLPETIEAGLNELAEAGLLVA